MIKGKYIMIVVIILLLSYLNYKMYVIFNTATYDDFETGDGGVQFLTVMLFIESFVGSAVLICNWKRMWNWKFNLNQLICKLKH